MKRLTHHCCWIGLPVLAAGCASGPKYAQSVFWKGRPVAAKRLTMMRIMQIRIIASLATQRRRNAGFR